MELPPEAMEFAMATINGLQNARFKGSAASMIIPDPPQVHQQSLQAIIEY
jgi:hypothetical protein